MDKDIKEQPATEIGSSKEVEANNNLNTEEIVKIVGAVVGSILNGKASDPSNNTTNNSITDFLNKQREEEKNIEQQDKLVRAYSNIYASFHQYVKNPEEAFANLKVDSLKTNERCNKLAQVIIAQAYGKGDQTNAMLASFEKQNVVDESTAFSLQYKNALEKLNSAKKSFVMKTPINTEISDDELAKLSNDLFSHKTREIALAKAKELKLIV